MDFRVVTEMFGVDCFIIVVDDAVFLAEGEAGVDGVVLGDSCEGRGDFVFNSLILLLLLKA